VATRGGLDPKPVEDARRFVETFWDYLDSRHPEVLRSIRDTGDLDEDTEATLTSALETFEQTFMPSEQPSGSAAAAGEGTPPDEVRRDVGWDRMSSVDEAPDSKDDAADRAQPHAEGPWGGEGEVPPGLPG
jgi:ATP synthase alpha/beta chain, C terminal domain